MAHADLMKSPAIPMLAENDLESGRRFWRDTIGVEEIGYDAQVGEAMYRAGGTVFALYQHEGGSKADHTQLAFQVDSVRATKRALEEDGVRFEDYEIPGLKTVQGIANMGEGTEGAWFTDPGGNIVGLFTLTHETQQKLKSMHLVEAGVTP